MMQDNDDPSASSDVPFVRRGPPDDLWPRISAAANATNRRQRAQAWALRIGSMAAGLLTWLAANAMLESAPTPSDSPEALARDERAWLWESTDALPPEAQLVTSLVAREGLQR